MSSNATYLFRTNENSKQLFPEKFTHYVPNSRQDYLRTAKTNKSNTIVSIFSHPKNRQNPLIMPALESVFTHLTDSERRGKTIAETMHSHLFGFFSQHKGATQEDLEDSCKEKLNSMILNYPKVMEGKMSARSKMVFSHLKPIIDGKTIVDIGAGNGKVGDFMSTKLKKDVSLVDVVDYKSPEVRLLMDLFDGKKLPYKDGQFDSSMLLMVLHHADKPLKLLEEAIRVTSGKIYIIESIYFNKEHKQLNAILDWQYNRVFADGVNCPFNFQTPSGWMDTFASYNLKMEKSIDLGLDLPIVPEYHWLFVLSK